MTTSRAKGTARGVGLSWSGGKDSALALWLMREELGIEPAALLTTFTEDFDRVSMHGVRRQLVRAQAEAAGLPLVEVGIPAACVNEVYEARMAAALAAPPLAEVGAMAFADLYLEDIRAYREERLTGAGREALFPLWGRDTAALARRFVAAGFEAILVCVDPRKLDPSFAGRSFDRSLLEDLPAGVDPCGEEGEFHTFVHAGPVFAAPIEVERGERVERDGFVFCDLLAAAGKR
ncbi:MAG: ATP-binding protein [Solirubrobacterales bacterium]